MDEAFSYFLKKFGPPLMKRDVSPAQIARHEADVPGQLIRYWEEHGLAGYGDGVYWTVDPTEYESTLEMALEPTAYRGRDVYKVIARTAFGVLFVWGKKTGKSFVIDVPNGFMIPRLPSALFNLSGGEDRAMQSFFAFEDRSFCEGIGDDKQPLFPRALAKLGLLAPDEMYGFEPASILAGSSLANLQKVKILPHLEILLGFASLTVMDAV